ncbi:hypothetical protein CMV43_06175 [Escherichia coli]|nr:hypothetical protein CMV43_06175 [Escherichia coli]
MELGQTVTVTFGGKTYTATVAGDGSWTTSVPAADLAALRDGDATVQASVSNINGNTASATHATASMPRHRRLPLTPSPPTIF